MNSTSVKEEEGMAHDATDSSSVRETTTVRAAGVVFGVLLVNFITTGLVNSYGVMLRSLETDVSSPYIDESHFNMGFVPGCAVGLIFVLGPFGNILISRYGVRTPIAIGVFLMTFSLMMASLASKFYQLLLSEGVLYGLGASLAFVPAMGLPSQFFPEKRGLVTGIGAAGSPIGGMILSPIIDAIVARASVQWALRFLGFVVLALGVLSTYLCKSKTTSSSSNKSGPVIATQYKFMDFSVLKARGYPLYLLFAFLQMFGYALPVLNLPNYALSLGLDANRGSQVIIILNVGNFIGRVIGGWLGDVAGVLNMLSIFTFISGLLCVVFWLFARTFATLAGFAFLWGIGAGAYWSLTVPATAAIVGMSRLGSAVSFNYLTNVIPPIFASPIGTAITNATARSMNVAASDPAAYRYFIVWAGLSYMVPACILLVVRFMLERRLLVRV